jgi:hypothetical protein
MDESHKLVQVYGSTTVNPPSVDTYNGLSWGTKCMAPRFVVVLKSYEAITLCSKHAASRSCFDEKHPNTLLSPRKIMIRLRVVRI